MKYLNPMADLTFKKVFGEHPDLVTSFLNALLPFETPEEEITEIEYLPAELVPETPFKKNSIVDVRCKDKQGRQFLVEMQMFWSSSFMQRVLFNASKTYVRQLGKNAHYELLQPVYSLNLVNEIFLPDIPGYYHDYRIVQVEHTDKIIEGLRFIFIELPKFTPKAYGDKKMQVLWLRYLTEIDEDTRQVAPDLLENPSIKKAVEQIEESSFTDAQLFGYDDFWDAVRVEKSYISDAEREGKQKGLKEGLERGMQKGMRKGMKQGIKQGIKEGIQKGIEQGIQKGIEQGVTKGKEEERLQIAHKMETEGIAIEVIERITGLTRDEINAL